VHARDRGERGVHDDRHGPHPGTRRTLLRELRLLRHGGVRVTRPRQPPLAAAGRLARRPCLTAPSLAATEERIWSRWSAPRRLARSGALRRAGRRPPRAGPGAAGGRAGAAGGGVARGGTTRRARGRGGGARGGGGLWRGWG